jgi:hypothetical protein
MITEAIISLRPGSEWTLDGTDYSGLTWLSTNTEKPTEDEINLEIQRLNDLKELNRYKKLRASEYPDFREYLDGVVKGDQEQIQNYIDACLAVKLKYPKPE